MFVHLRCPSHYSFWRGVNPPEEIIAAAVEQTMPAVALTDTNGMYGAVAFYKAALAAGVKPISGVTLEVERKSGPSASLRAGEWPFDCAQSRRVTSDELRKLQNRAKDDSSPSVSMVLLAADAVGYSNLCRLTTLWHLGTVRPGQDTFAEQEEQPVTLEELAEHSCGVIALWPAGECLRGGGAGAGPADATKAPTSVG